jgi:hypothetical protein
MDGWTTSKGSFKNKIQHRMSPLDLFNHTIFTYPIWRDAPFKYRRSVYVEWTVLEMADTYLIIKHKKLRIIYVQATQKNLCNW